MQRLFALSKHCRFWDLDGIGNTQLFILLGMHDSFFESQTLTSRIFLFVKQEIVWRVNTCRVETQVAGGVGTQTYDNMFQDREREDFTQFESSGSCPLDADCVGVPNPATQGLGMNGSGGLLDLMVSSTLSNFCHSLSVWVHAQRHICSTENYSQPKASNVRVDVLHAESASRVHSHAYCLCMPCRTCIQHFAVA